MARFGDLDTQYFDDAGNPLVNGKVYFYESGTTTLKNTFADVNLSIPNTNPVILTAAGRQPNIFFDGVAKAILTSNSDVQILVRDPVGETATDFGDEWVATKIYGANDVVLGSDGVYYRSLVSGNQNNNPVSTTNFWTLLYSVEWNAGITYQVGAVVTYDGEQYQSLQGSNLNQNPSTASSYWVLLSFAWLATATYSDGQNAVGTDGILYTSLQDGNIGNDPATSPAYWVGTSAAAAASAVAAAASEAAAAASESAAAASEAAAETAETNAETAQAAAEAAQSAAETAETNAETAETGAEAAQAAAEAAQSAAETAQANAETAETNAETAETNAETAQAAAEAAQSAAETAQTGAETAETNAETAQAAAEAAQAAAETAETNAETAETNAETAQAAAEAAQSAAETAESNAATSASNASDSEDAAAASAAAAASSYDQFDDRYLGDKASDPTVDNDGNALLTGALYFNTTSDDMKVYNGSAWQVTAINPTDPTFTGTVTADGLDINGEATMDGLTVDLAGSYAVIRKPNEGGIGGALFLQNNISSSATGSGSQLKFLSGTSFARNVYIQTSSAGTFGRNPNLFIGSNNDGDGNVDHLQIANNGDISFYEDTGTTPKFFWDASAESLGIGTSSPTRLLDVHGAASFQDSTGEKQLLIANDDTLVRFYSRNRSDASDIPMGFYTGITERMRIESDGDIDLGDFSSSNYTWIRPYEATTGNMIISADKGATGTGGSAMIFQCRGGEKMRINGASGNVGIGTSSPSPSDGTGLAVHISDVADNPEIRLQRTSTFTADYSIRAGGASTGRLRFKNNDSTNDVMTFYGDNVGIGTTSADTNLEVSDNVNATIRISSTKNDASWNVETDAYGKLEWYSADTSGNASVRAAIWATPATTIGANSDLSFYTKGTTSSYPTERMRIDSNGRVGIGTDNPDTDFVISEGGVQGLEIQAWEGGDTVRLLGFNRSTSSRVPVTIDASQVIFQADTISERMRIDSSGNVGIGTSSPAYLVDAYGPVASRGSGVGNAAFVLQEVGNNPWYVTQFTGGTFGILYNGTNSGNTKLAIDSSGNVGIGTTSPSELLEVSANTGASIKIASTDTLIAAGEIIGSIKFESNDASGTPPHISGQIDVIAEDAFGRGAMAFSTGRNLDFQEAMRIDSSGNVLVGKTVGGSATIGIQANADGALIATRDGNIAGLLNRLTSDGDILEFRKDGTTVGSIGSLGGYTHFISGTGGIRPIDNTQLRPVNSDGTGSDGTMDLGTSGIRFQDIYATNATIQTSDRNEKQDIESLSDAETRVAVAVKGLLRKFRWKSAVEEKGDDARIHFGIIAQDLQAAFEAEGLDAGRYAMFIHSTWTDEETGEERSRMGVRYSELLSFIIAAI